ncbi:integrase core domain [Brachionus plicatilis]|uniref:Integrase core domain n=1 Tax=Brachionus plicatilis TaxID=10195 RepID=A0A3M7Q637_BRAPC|nr:integrase core domain [Brachionus plicatilis]
MFEPRPEKLNNLNQQAIWARSVGNVSSEGRLRVSVMNITERDIMLEEGAEVGVWEEVEIDEESEVESLNEDGDIKWDTIQINPELTIKQQKSVKELITKYKKAFKWTEYDVGTTHVTKHDSGFVIETTSGVCEQAGNGCECRLGRRAGQRPVNRSGKVRRENSIVVPKQLRKLVCQLYHNEISAGHLSYEKTYKTISRRYYWPQMKSEIYDYCKSCEKCQLTKPKNSTGVH